MYSGVAVTYDGQWDFMHNVCWSLYSFLRRDGRDKIFKNPPFLISHISSVPQCESLIVACQETMEDFVARKFKWSR